MNGRHIFTTACAVAVVLCVGVGPAGAQTSNDGSVRGYVKDAQGGVLPGVTVSATSETAPTGRMAVSDPSGYFRLDNLLPATYAITAELQGFSKYRRDGIVVRAGLNLSLEIVMAVGGFSEIVEVKAETPMLEATTSVQAVNFSEEFQARMPITARRNWADVLSVVPGMVSAEGGLGGSTGNYYLRGAGRTSQVIAIDGGDMGGAQNSAANGTNISLEAIVDTQVKTGAVDASSPLGFGVVANMVTKSGTNTLRGSASLAYQASSWNGNNVPGGTSAAAATTQADFSLGGPILKNRVWYFGAYRYLTRSVGISRSATELANLKALYPEFTPFDSNDRFYEPFIKVTAQFGPKHQVSAYYQDDSAPTNGGLSTEVKAFGTAESGGLGWSANVSSVWSSAWITRFAASYNAKTFIRNYPNDKSTPVYRTFNLSSGRLVGNTLLAWLGNANNGVSFDQPYSKSMVSGDVTYYRSARGGAHEVKAGFYFQPNVHAGQVVYYANDGFSREELVLRDPNNPAGGTIPFSRRVYDNPIETSIDADTSDHAFYVQDNWRPTSSLTVNAGVRVDRIRRVDNLFDLETQNSIDVGPRVGLNYILTKDQRNAIYASWVRVHEMPQIGLFTAGSTSTGIRDLYDTNRDGVFETEFYTPTNTVLSSNRMVDPKRHQPHINEAIVGYRRQLPGQLTVDVSFAHRRFMNLIASYNVNGIYENGVFKGYRDVSQNDILLTTNTVDNWKVYNGIDILVTKQTRSLQLVANYGRQWRHISGTWDPNDPASFIQPNAFANNKGIGGTTNVEANNLSGTAQTNTPNWRDHVFRLAASYELPWQFRVATNYVVQSGVWSGPIVT
ncbi:MAG: TonB-dependent receptor, partial [Planctomycetes bacterium]|nr:TonB-dependent receptor [Planctomycetota bacterium]